MENFCSNLPGWMHSVEVKIITRYRGEDLNWIKGQPEMVYNLEIRQSKSSSLIFPSHTLYKIP